MLITERMDHIKFSHSEQIIVDYLKKEQLNIENKSTSEVAQETFSSKSTIVKVAKRLNFNGWSDFKKAYIDELKYLSTPHGTIDANYPFEANDHFITIAKKIALLEQEASQETSSMLHFADLHKAIELFTQSKAIHLFAVSNNLLIAEEFRYNMERIRKQVRVHSRQGEGNYAATLMEPDECALVISYSGETETLMRVVKILKERNIPIVLITSIGENSMSSVADCVLRISSRERLYSKIATFANDASITYVLDVLYSCMFKQDYDTNIELRKETSRVFEIGRNSNVNLLKEN